MYNFIKISEKIFDVLMKIILFVPMGIKILFCLLFNEYENYRLNKGYSDRTIKRYIKYCDDYYKDKYHNKLFILDDSYFEYKKYLTISDFVNNIQPYFIYNKIQNIYYSNSYKRFIEKLKEYYEPRLLSQNELKQEFTREDGSISFWYDSIKDKKVVKF